MDSQNQPSFSKPQTSAILQLAQCETKIHSAFCRLFWRNEFDFFEDFQIRLSTPLSEGSLFALPLGKLDLDREDEEPILFPSYQKTVDLKKEMEKQLGVTPCSALILEVKKVTQTPPKTVEVQVVAVVQSVPKI